MDIMENITYTLTNSQEKAINTMIDWAFKLPEKKKDFFLTLKGSAGTGKTFITNLFIQKTLLRKAIVVSAPTHKATKVISNVTGKSGLTIQALCGLRPNTDLENFDINRPQFGQKAQPQINKYDLLILDEASMLNKDLFTLIVNTALDYDVKVLFIGDELQLPPVKEFKSKALTDIKNVVELTEIVRQTDTNPMGNLLTTLRQDIIDDSMEFKKYLTDEICEINSEGEGYIAIGNTPDFINMMKNEFTSSLFQADKNHCKYVAWTNQTVTEGNKHIRKMLFNTDAMITEGDLLMAYKTIRDKKEIIITNSEDYVITNLSFHTNNFDISGYQITLNCLSSNIETNTFIVSPDSYKDFVEIHNAKLKDAKAYRHPSAWQSYYNFKNKHLLLTDIMDNYGRIIVRKDLDYGYGITVHKTQGSTYNTVFVNGKDIARNSRSVEAKKLFYVALSRASKQVIILL